MVRAAHKRSAFLASTAAAVAVPNVILAQALPTLRVAGTASQDIIGTLYGIHGGVFRKYGLDVEYTYMGSGATVLAALLGGSLEIGKVVVFNLILAHGKNVPVLIEVPCAIYLADAPDAGTVVAKDSPIRNAADLNGKTLAVPALGDFFAVANMNWIDTNGGDSRTVKFVELSNRATVAALASGRVDAGTLVQPILGEAIAGGTARLLGYSMSVSKEYAATAYVTTPSYAAQNADVLARFRRALSEASTYANGHRAEMIPILAQNTGVDPKEIARVSASTLGTAAQLRDSSLFQPVIDLAGRYKAIPKAFPYTELIDPKALVG